MVRKNAPSAHPNPARRVAGPRLGTKRPPHRSYRKREDLGGLPLGNRPGEPPRPRCQSRRSDPVRIAPEGAGVRRGAKSARASRGNRRLRRRRASLPQHARERAHGGYHVEGKAPALARAGGRARHHSRVALSPSRLAGLRPSQDRAHRDRRRYSRPRRNEARRPPGPFARETLGADGARSPAHRSFGHRSPSGRGRAVSRRRPRRRGRRCQRARPRRPFHSCARAGAGERARYFMGPGLHRDPRSSPGASVDTHLRQQPLARRENRTAAERARRGSAPPRSPWKPFPPEAQRD